MPGTTDDAKRAATPKEANDEFEDGEFDPDEYDEMLQLERLESIEEEMMELGVTTLEDVRERIAELHRTMDEHERR